MGAEQSEPAAASEPGSRPRRGAPKAAATDWIEQNILNNSGKYVKFLKDSFLKKKKGKSRSYLLPPVWWYYLNVLLHV